jgi:hypothetical protein
MGWDTSRFAQGAASGGLLPGVGYGFFGGGGEDPEKEAMGYLDKIPGEAHRNLDPWVDYGRSLTQDPGGRLNQIGQGYHQSPGFQFALQQALQGAGHAAASGGMAGSPQHEQENMGIATNLGNQDYNNWMTNALGLHNTGFAGGMGASTNINDQIIQALAQKANLSYAGQQGRNEGMGNMFGNIIGAGANLAAFM